MPRNKIRLTAAAMLALAAQPAPAQTYSEPFRPQFHFTPPQNWMNDPNGLVYDDGHYDMYFQYNPTGNNWGNMSWGHASGADLVHWAQQPVALPFQTNKAGQDTQLFFSGSAVLDADNTSGLGTAANPPLVAIYTSFFASNTTMPDGRFMQAGTQAQSIAYSLDHGVTWAQYAGDPVIATPPAPYQDQYQNFRDPKVFWYAPERKWVMVVSLATEHKVLLFSSHDLKRWGLMSEFGPANAVGGNWECPDLFSLPVDGNPDARKWVLMLGVNPGAVAGGSGTQYILGRFDGRTFTADANQIVAADAPAGSQTLFDFNGNTYAEQRWQATGDLAGTAPTAGALNGQSAVTGVHSGFFVDTFENGDGSTGTLTSPVFTIARPYLNFKIGGGYHPYNPATYGTAADNETAVNLLVGGHVVATATGTNGEALSWTSWNVAAYQGQKARIQVVDRNSGGWGHINADYFVLSDAAQPQAQWVDYGPDFYAANSWNNAPRNRRITIAWMNNWNYGGNIPTAPWRSAMSVPRQLGLQTVDGQVRLTQVPVASLPSLFSQPLYETAAKTTVLPGTWPGLVHNVKGKALTIGATFTPGTASQFGLMVRTGANGERTEIGYDATSQSVYVNRFASGQSGFDQSFAGRYTAPLKPDADGHVKLRVLVDWSSVELFAGAGEAVVTAQIFPQATSDGLAVFARGGFATLDGVTVRSVASIWK